MKKENIRSYFYTDSWLKIVVKKDELIFMKLKDFVDLYLCVFLQLIK